MDEQLRHYENKLSFEIEPWDLRCATGWEWFKKVWARVDGKWPVKVFRHKPPPKMEITVASAFDWGTASEILMDVVTWLNEKGEPLWTEEQVSVEGLKSSYRIEESFIAQQKNKPSGCMFLLESDPYFWPEIEDDSSLFLHKLSVLREFKGQGIGNRMLEWACQYAKRQGKSWLRLDCDGGRPKLRQIYDSFGFRLVDRKPLGEFDSARYEIRV